MRNNGDNWYLMQGARRGRAYPEHRAPCQPPLGRQSGTKRTDEDGVASIETGLVWPVLLLSRDVTYQVATPVEGVPTKGSPISSS